MGNPEIPEALPDIVLGPPILAAAATAFRFVGNTALAVTCEARLGDYLTNVVIDGPKNVVQRKFVPQYDDAYDVTLPIDQIEPLQRGLAPQIVELSEKAGLASFFTVDYFRNHGAWRRDREALCVIKDTYLHLSAIQKRVAQVSDPGQQYHSFWNR